MLKCKKEYKRHSTRYQAGEEYDISKEKAEADEAYFGEKLWATGTKKADKTPEEEAKAEAEAKAKEEADAKAKADAEAEAKKAADKK